MTEQCLAPAAVRNYSHSYFRNGFFRNQVEKAATGKPDVLTFETGYFGLEFDLDDLSKPRFGTFSDPVSYEESIQRDYRTKDRIENDLSEQDLEMKITVDGIDFFARTCAATEDTGPKRFNVGVILWEAGKFTQHYEVLDLKFEPLGDNDGDGSCDTDFFEKTRVNLSIVVWPESFSLTLKLDREGENIDSALKMALNFIDWSVEKEYSSTAATESTEYSTSLVCDVRQDARDKLRESVTVEVSHHVAKNIPVPVDFNDQYDSFFCTANFGRGPHRLWRPFAPAYTDIRDYDEFIVKVTNVSEDKHYYVPFVLYIRQVANCTGVCPIVCELDGTPTGIPIQVSKNWHDDKRPNYSYFFTMFPVEAGSEKVFLIRVAYGFYGKLPSASHAQLSLAGPLNGNGRWEQLAVGCFGETLCLDPEITATIDMRITDCRGLMFRQGRDGTKWGWTQCGWGGDFLRAYDGEERLQVTGMKTAYVAHGPCLTDVRYAGFFGERQQVDFTVRVRTVRTDDYARNLFTFDYKFNRDVNLGEDGYLHMMYNQGYHTPTIATGFRGNMTMEESVPEGLENREVFKPSKSLAGRAPFWVSFPDSVPFEQRRGRKNMPSGTKHMIIRDFEATVGGSRHIHPSVAFINVEYRGRWIQGTQPSLYATVDAPTRQFEAGDSVKMEIEWMTSSLVADDYYGDNHNYRSHLVLHPRSWETPKREALLNCFLIGVKIEGGQVEQQYPLSIFVQDDKEVSFAMTGGVGGFPMEFKGLKHCNYSLYQVKDNGEEVMVNQSHHQNDFWQTEFETKNGTYTMTFNPELGSAFETKWKLKAN